MSEPPPTPDEQMRAIIERMAGYAERAAQAAQSVATDAGTLAKDAAAVATMLRESGNIPLQQTGWFLSRLEFEAIATQERLFSEAWGELQAAAVERARLRQREDNQSLRNGGMGRMP